MAVIKGYIKAITDKNRYGLLKSICNGALLDSRSGAELDGGSFNLRVMSVEIINFDKGDLKAFESALFKELKQWREFKGFELKIGDGYRKNEILVCLIRDDYEEFMAEAGFTPDYTSYKSIGRL